MPTYEYRCPEGHEFERFQKMSDDPVAECPECGRRAERVLSGGAGFLFKGEGFYATDYRSEEYRKKKEKEKKGTHDGSGSGASGSDAPGSGGSGGGGEGGPGGGSEPRAGEDE